MNGKVFIVKMTKVEHSHNSKVKRVFWCEENALAYIDKSKVEEKWKDFHWIVSDRTMPDFQPSLSLNEIKIARLEAQQELIEEMIEDFKGDSKYIMDLSILEAYWADLEAKIIKLNI